MADETHLSDVLASILDRRERGEAVDPEAILRAHPDLADDLRVHFAAAQFVDAALAGLAPRAAPLPERIGSFRVERELGSGGMGTVYAATADAAVPGVKAGARVALKVVHAHLLRRPGFFRRFVREAELGRRVQHDNVVRTLFVDATLEGDAPCHFLAMEFVEGQTLRDLLGEVDRVPEELCRHIASEVAKGLAAMHAAGVVHRDLKPENVLITKDHAVKVMDLGVAQLADEAIRLSQTGAFVGSLHYAAPEQLTDSEHVDGRADLHALGLVLYELATGKHPYGAGGGGGGGGDARAILRKVLDETPRRCAEINPQLSPFFEEVVHTLLAKERDERFPTAAALLAVLGDGEKSEWWRDRAKAIRRATKRPLRRIRIPRETALYGRDAELARLGALWGAAKSGDGQVVLLEGEAGIGKSRLVDEFVAGLQSAGEDLHFLFGSSPPGGAATASGAFCTAYREQFGEAGLEDSLREHLTETPILVPALAALLRGDAAPTGAEPLTKDSLQTVFVHCTRSLAAQRPTIVLIDDLHFAPEEGRALFASLALAVPGHRILLVGTLRPGVPETWTANVARLGHTTHLTIPRLGPKDLVRLLRDAFGSEHLANELSGRIAEKSDGNPFFVFEIVRGLREGHFLRQRQDGTWETTQILRDITVPSSVLDLVNARVADLDDAERNLLDVASCVGFEFDAGLVGDALGMQRVPVLQAMARIEKRHRLVRASGRVFVFDHHQVREALYGALPEPLREEYHAAIGDALERRTGAAAKDPKDLDGALCADLAEHFLTGARGPSALRYVDAALTHLERNYLNDRAVVLADRALSVPGLVPEGARATLLLRKADRLAFLGRREAQRGAIEEALAIAQETGDRSIEAAAIGGLGLVHSALGQYPEARDLHQRHLARTHELRDRRAEVRAMSNLSQVLCCLGSLAPAREHAERAVSLAREIEDLRGEALAVRMLGAVHLYLGRIDDLREMSQRALELSRQLGDRVGEAGATVNLGNAFRQLGQIAQAQDCYERGLAISREVGHRQFESNATGNLGVVFLDLDRPDDARGWFERRLSLAREIGDRRGEAHSTGNLGLVFLGLGRLAEARTHYERDLALEQEIGNRVGEALAVGSLGTIAHSLGRLDEARASQHRSLALAREVGDATDEANALAHLAALSAEAGDSVGAEQLLAEAVALHRRIGTRRNEAETLCDRGMHFAATGREVEARADLSASLAISRELSLVRHEVVAGAALATLPGSDATSALAAFAEHRRHLELRQAMEVRMLLFRATRDPAHLAEAKRLLDFLVEHAPPECREAMLTNVRLHREIAAAAAGAGL